MRFYNNNKNSRWCHWEFFLNLGVDFRVVVWIREFLLGHMQRIRVGGHLSEEIRVMSGVLQGSVLGPLLFLAYVNDILWNVESTIRLLLMTV